MGPEPTHPPPGKRGYAGSRLATPTLGELGVVTGPEPTLQVLRAPLTYEWHDGRGEDAAALEHEGQAGAHEDG